MKNVQYVKIKVWYFENFLFVYKSRTLVCVHKKDAQKIFTKMLHIFNSMNKLRTPFQNQVTSRKIVIKNSPCICEWV